jgi:hypothetical protein
MRHTKASDMTYREYLVGQALSGLMQGTPPPTEGSVATLALKYANAVIDELERDRAIRQGVEHKKT